MSVYANEHHRYLELSLRSLAEQTRRADEIVLVEDGPIGRNLSTTIELYRKHLNIRSIALPKNVGLGAALSEGLKACQGKFIARMDTDDIAFCTRFSRQLDTFAADDRLDILSGYAVEIDASGHSGRVRTVPVEHDAIVRTLWANPIIHPAVMFRRAAILEIGGYSPTAIRCEDYELWFRCVERGMRFGNIPEPLIKYRLTPETHQRYLRRNKWRQGQIGFCGSRRIGLPLWVQLACFAPFCCSLLPQLLQHKAYRLMQPFDPRGTTDS